MASAKTATSGKDGDKQVIDSSTASAPSEQPAASAHVKKTVTDVETGPEKPTSDKTGTDKTETKQDTAATSADGSDASKAPKAVAYTGGRA